MSLNQVNLDRHYQSWGKPSTPLILEQLDLLATTINSTLNEIGSESSRKQELQTSLLHHAFEGAIASDLKLQIQSCFHALNLVDEYSQLFKKYSHTRSYMGTGMRRTQTNEHGEITSETVFDADAIARRLSTNSGACRNFLEGQIIPHLDYLNSMGLGFFYFNQNESKFITVEDLKDKEPSKLTIKIKDPAKFLSFIEAGFDTDDNGLKENLRRLIYFTLQEEFKSNSEFTHSNLSNLNLPAYRERLTQSPLWQGDLMSRIFQIAAAKGYPLEESFLEKKFRNSMSISFNSTPKNLMVIKDDDVINATKGKYASELFFLIRNGFIEDPISEVSSWSTIRKYCCYDQANYSDMLNDLREVLDSLETNPQAKDFYERVLYCVDSMIEENIEEHGGLEENYRDINIDLPGSPANGVKQGYHEINLEPLKQFQTEVQERIQGL